MSFFSSWFLAASSGFMIRFAHLYVSYQVSYIIRYECMYKSIPYTRYTPPINANSMRTDTNIHLRELLAAAILSYQYGTAIVCRKEFGFGAAVTVTPFPMSSTTWMHSNAIRHHVTAATPQSAQFLWVGHHMAMEFPWLKQ